MILVRLNDQCEMYPTSLVVCDLNQFGKQEYTLYKYTPVAPIGLTIAVYIHW